MNLKDKLNAELESLVPKMSKDVYNAPFPSVTETEKEVAPAQTKKPFKTFLRVGLALAASLIILLSVLIPSLNKGGNKIYEPNSVVLLEVNPSIKIVSNDKGEIISLSSANEDADVIISEDGLLNKVIGKTLDKGLEILIEKCVEYGFINDSGSSNAIKVTVSNENLEKGKEIATSVNEKVANFLSGKDINALLTVGSEAIDEVAKKLGFNFTSATNFIEEIKNSYTLKAEEKFSIINDENYIDNYKNSVVNYVKDSVSGIYGNILSKRNDLTAIDENFEKIKNHESNILKLDYFLLNTIGNLGELGLDESLKKLIEDTTNKITAFEVKYGTVLNEINATILIEIYKNLNVDEIRKNILDLTANISNSDFSVKAFVLTVGAMIPDDDFKNYINNIFSHLENEPSSREDYINKEKDALAKKAEDKKLNAKEYYEKKFLKK